MCIYIFLPWCFEKLHKRHNVCAPVCYGHLLYCCFISVLKNNFINVYDIQPAVINIKKPELILLSFTLTDCLVSCALSELITQSRVGLST